MASLGKVLAGVVHTVFPAAVEGVEKPVSHPVGMPMRLPQGSPLAAATAPQY